MNGDLAKIAYEAYRQSLNEIAKLGGVELSEWELLRPTEQAGWAAAAAAIAEQHPDKQRLNWFERRWRDTDDPPVIYLIAEGFLPSTSGTWPGAMSLRDAIDRMKELAVCRVCGDPIDTDGENQALCDDCACEQAEDELADGDAAC